MPSKTLRETQQPLFSMLKSFLFAAWVLSTLAQGKVETTDERRLIFGGQQTQINKYPYFTRFELAPADRAQVCGGTLVAPDMVLTHPLCPPMVAEARVGFYSEIGESTEEVFDFQEQNLFQHPAYNADTFDYAFLLVKLDGASTKAYARLNSDPAVPSADTVLVTMGTGNKEPVGLGTRETRLSEASLPFIDREACESERAERRRRSGSMIQTGFTYKDLISDSVFCAGSADFGACEDDWGGPLVVKASNSNPAEDVLVGVFSWTFGCGPTPSVFSRVSAGFDWLRYTICTESSNPPAYLNCASATDPKILDREGPPIPPNPIQFKWTLQPDDFNYEYAFTLERIEGLESIKKVASLVPGAIPFGFESTYEQTLTLQAGVLYAWTVHDAAGDGLEGDSNGATLQLADSDSTFQVFHTEDNAFSGFMSYVFNASLGSNIEDPCVQVNTFPGSTAFLKMEIVFDDHPWEFGWQLTTEAGEMIVYRPPRCYYDAGASQTDSFPVPRELTKYKLTVVDTYGDGLKGSQTFYAMKDSTNKVLIESLFRDTGKEEKSFQYGASGAQFAHAGIVAILTLFGVFLGL